MEQKQNRKKDYRRKKKQKRILLFLTFFLLLAVGAFVGSRFYHEYVSQQNMAEGAVQTEGSQSMAGSAAQNGGGEKLAVHFIDVGQGDATLITLGEHAMLIDAGNNDMGTTVQLYLKKVGVKKLDYVIGTHPDADHIGGLDVILTKFDCGRVIMPEIERENTTYQEVTEAMEYRRYEKTLPVTGKTYPFGEAYFTVVSAEGDYGEEYNNYSVGIHLSYGDTSFLFVGDAEKEAEEVMLKTGLSLKSTVLKVGHHGSSDSTSEAFLLAVEPEMAVISCGMGNDYGHPHRRTLDKLREEKIEVYRTDEQGSIVAISDGKSIFFDTEPSVSWKSGWDE